MRLRDDAGMLACGYIKAKFPHLRDRDLFDNPAYEWAASAANPRVTAHFIYVAMGHTDIPDNDAARKLIKTIEGFGGKITRLDFSIDYAAQFGYGAFYRLHDTGKSPFPMIIHSPRGDSVYIGGRASARVLRVYNKRLEILARTKQDIGIELTRIEIEIKRNLVSRYKALLLDHREHDILSDIQHRYGLRGFCERSQACKCHDRRPKNISHWRFVQRYKTIIRRAYLEDPDAFLETIGVMQDGSGKSN